MGRKPPSARPGGALPCSSQSNASGKRRPSHVCLENVHTGGKQRSRAAEPGDNDFYPETGDSQECDRPIGSPTALHARLKQLPTPHHDSWQGRLREGSLRFAMFRRSDHGHPRLEGSGGPARGSARNCAFRGCATRASIEACRRLPPRTRATSPAPPDHWPAKAASSAPRRSAISDRSRRRYCVLPPTSGCPRNAHPARPPY
jgi:hypothetical protein